MDPYGLFYDLYADRPGYPKKDRHTANFFADPFEISFHSRPGGVHIPFILCHWAIAPAWGTMECRQQSFAGDLCAGQPDTYGILYLNVGLSCFLQSIVKSVKAEDGS